MSLFSSLNLARLALGAHQTAIQTVGQNIANANTEGYARQRVELTPTRSDDLIFARVGTGVRIERIERIVDQHLEGNLRDARSALADLNEQVRIFDMSESIFNDLAGGGLGESVARFFEALEDLANNPEDPTARYELVVQSETLVETFHFLDSGVRQVRQDLDDDVVSAIGMINGLTTEIAELNRKIVEAEDGGIHPDVANDLRSRRDAALGELSDLIEIKVIENDRGSVQVLSGNDVLVIDGRSRQLRLDPKSDGDISFHDVRFVDDGNRLDPKGGRIRALLEGRDGLVTSMRDRIDEIAGNLIQRFNEVHSGAEGLQRHTEIRSRNAVTSAAVPLRQAGFPFPVEDGRFSFQVINEGNGARETYTIDIDADGLGNDMSLNDLVDAINAQVGIEHPEIVANVTVDGFLEVRSSDPSLTFTFREDDSNFLVAAGIGSFFTGSNARDIDLDQRIVADPSLFAAGRGGGVGDNTAALEMLALRDDGFLGTTEMTFEQYYETFVGEIGIQGFEARELRENQEAIHLSVKNQREALSGVNVDEEAIQLIQYQRAYQGAARFLDIVDGLLETLIASV